MIVMILRSTKEKIIKTEIKQLTKNKTGGQSLENNVVE